MNAMNRYDTSGLIENQYEPGSRGRVLKNLLGIKNKRDMEKQETNELHRTAEKLIESLSADHRFSANDICAMHRQWLSSIYEWAGSYRQVFISKGGFPFAAPSVIPELMHDFEKNFLQPYTPSYIQPLSATLFSYAKSFFIGMCSCTDSMSLESLIDSPLNSIIRSIDFSISSEKKYSWSFGANLFIFEAKITDGPNESQPKPNTPISAFVDIVAKILSHKKMGMIFQ